MDRVIMTSGHRWSWLLQIREGKTRLWVVFCKLLSFILSIIFFSSSLLAADVSCVVIAKGADSSIKVRTTVAASSVPKCNQPPCFAAESGAL